MSRRRRGSKKRREDLLSSLESSGRGFATLDGTKKLIVEPAEKHFGGKPATCTITGHYRTLIFRFPGSYLMAEEPVDHQVIYSRDSCKASIVSDLLAYFEESPAESPHYSIAVSLRAGVRSIYEKAVEQANQKPHPEVPLFVVIEEYAKVPPTELNSGECFTLDECRNGKAIIEGGREGERALFAVRADDGAWPDFHADMSVVNMVLTAVKVEQNVDRHIEMLCNHSCFVSNEGQAVYSIEASFEGLSLVVQSRLEPSTLRKKADKIGALLQGMMSDSEPAVSELFDSILLDKTKDDGYLRLWYLRLWQAVEDAKKYLGSPQLDNIDTVIAGERTPKELKEYRNDIAHWHTGKIDDAYLRDLQYTALELLRRKYRPTKDGESDRSERHR